MSSSQRRRDRGQHESMALYYAAGAAIGVVVVVYLCWRIGLWLAGDHSDMPANPVNAFIELGTGKQRWPVQATILVALVATLAAIIAVWWSKRWHDGAILREFDRRAEFLPSANELHSVNARSARRSAQRLRRDRIGHRFDNGLVLGRLVRGNAQLYMPWEWVGTIVGGPRSGKTTGYAIPWICQAPGPVFATSNKPDIYDATRWVRDRNDPPHAARAKEVHAQTGVRALTTAIAQRREPPRVRGHIWVSDLQHIAGNEGQQWWWDPFWYITELNDARELAAIFAGAETAESSHVDAYFDGGAKELLALHVLAAAVGGGDLKHVDGWLTDPHLDVAREVLRRNGHPDAAAKIETAANLNPRQQDGLYDMARRFINIMTVPAYARSVLPPSRVRFEGDNTIGNVDLTHDLPKFDPRAFVTSTDTMYALSMEGAGAATALTTALADSIFKAGVQQARRDGGRLGTPVLGILDEAANVCKLPDLPDWYSHFGSQGVVIVSMFQSLAQAAKIWSDKKLEMLLDSSNAYIFAGSSNNESYLSGLSRMVGPRDVLRRSRSQSGAAAWGSTSTSDSWSSEPILGTDDLKAMPLERALLATSGNRTVLTKKNFWWDGPYADLINTSKAACERARTAAARTAPVSRPRVSVDDRP
ncbi:type IV secretory system conjugative DNA transfer family protein [Gordonia sputi]